MKHSPEQRRLAGLTQQELADKIGTKKRRQEMEIKNNRHRMRVIAWCALLGVVLLIGSCSNNDKEMDEPVLMGKITSYNEFNSAMLDIREEDMTKAGFTLGDLISITVDGREIIMPYYDGYYGWNGDFVCVDYPSYPSICFTTCNIGLPQDLMNLEGHAVTIRLKEKGGCLDVQKALSMQYTNRREDYSTFTDAQFANARSVSVTGIPPGRLHRSSTPFSDEIGRSSYVSDYLSEQGVVTVLNLTDTEEKMQSYNMPSYSHSLWEGGNVILCPLKSDPTADDYNTRLIENLKELTSRPAPYLVNCTEGKDRTGYVCALLEGLCGATYDEIVADYLITYNNYYHVTPEKDPDVCSTLVSMRLNNCLMYYAGVTDEAQLRTVDYAKAFSSYLLSHGMSQAQLNALILALTE